MIRNRAEEEVQQQLGTIQTIGEAVADKVGLIS
jgi:hypothetical protein